MSEELLSKALGFGNGLTEIVDLRATRTETGDWELELVVRDPELPAVPEREPIPLLYPTWHQVYFDWGIRDNAPWANKRKAA